MPKENRKRGRRDEEKKRKRDGHDDDATHKRHKKSQDGLRDSAPQDGEQYYGGGLEGEPRPDGMPELPYYGQLDEEEQEYFKRADELLELNQFEGPDERAMFLENVYQEADGKELKIANSQSCSRLMERLILLSTPAQLKKLFQVFSGHFLNLVQHRFASHCCEALFIHAAPMVTQEMVAPPEDELSDPNEIVASMENLYLYAINELEGYLGYLMTDPYASHTLRVLLLVLAGLPLSNPARKSPVQSKRKEKVGVAGVDKSSELTLEKRTVPESFTAALEKIINDSVSTLDTSYLRALAEHQTGNPTLQLLLRLELSEFGKQRAKDENSIIHRLLPDSPISEGTESAQFINGLIYSPIGSRLLETIIEHAPGKMFKALYREFFKERMGRLSRNEVAGYVAGKILERLNKEDLEEAMYQIVEQIPGLVERNRTAIMKTLIERCAIRGVTTAPIAAQLEAGYGGANGFEISRLLKLGVASDSALEKSHPDKLHGSLLAQAMLAVPGPLCNLIFDSLARIGSSLSLKIARDPTASRTLQAALTLPTATIIFRRKIIQHFYGHIAEMALDPAASHVIDSVWQGTHGLAFIRERIAEELAENEAAMRESFVGRAVWRNWKMDLYKRRRTDWVKESRNSAGTEGFQSFPESNGGVKKEGGKHLTAIEFARQKHAANKLKKEREAKTSQQEAYEASKGKGKAAVTA